MVDQKISSAPLSTPLARRVPVNDPSIEKFVLEEIAKLAKAAQSEGEIVILVDACAIRHHVRDEVKELCEKTGFPVYAAPMGKTVISEEYERYGGVCKFLLPSFDIRKFTKVCRCLGFRFTSGISQPQKSRKKSRMQS
jgi:TPP-dependent 2-oxoacid decarboxylase